VDLDEAIRSCVRLIDERAKRGQVTVEYKPTAAPPLLRADGRRIRQILINLLSNAVKFTPPSGRVAIHVIASEGGGVVVAIVDTGIGIKADDMEKVMAPFGQADTSLERQYEGTGLGLPLCKAFAEMHDGRLFLESTPGSGTAACLFLPSARVRWKAVAA
jgi:signal transduction histidine kinase